MKKTILITSILLIIASIITFIIESTNNNIDTDKFIKPEKYNAPNEINNDPPFAELNESYSVEIDKNFRLTQFTDLDIHQYRIGNEYFSPSLMPIEIQYVQYENSSELKKAFTGPFAFGSASNVNDDENFRKFETAYYDLLFNGYQSKINELPFKWIEHVAMPKFNHLVNKILYINRDNGDPNAVVRAFKIDSDGNIFAFFLYNDLICIKDKYGFNFVSSSRNSLNENFEYEDITEKIKKDISEKSYLVRFNDNETYSPVYSKEYIDKLIHNDKYLISISIIIFFAGLILLLIYGIIKTSSPKNPTQKDENIDDRFSETNTNEKNITDNSKYDDVNKSSLLSQNEPTNPPQKLEEL